MLDRYDQDLLLDYLEGELDADRRAQFEAMLAEDTQLATLLEQLAADRDALRSLPRAEAPGDLVHDVTQSLERRMLLDDAVVNEAGPIPIARGRDLPGEPSRGPRWGRVAGLSALAASVAIAAGVVVFLNDGDPLTNVANQLGAQSDEPEAAETDPATDFAFSGTGEVDEEAADDARARIARPGPAEPPAAITPNTPIALDTLPDADRIPPILQPGAGDGLADTPAPTAGGDERAARRSTNTPQPAVALAITQPRQELVLVTEAPELTRDQLVAFCVTNGIPIVETNLIDNGYAPRTQFAQAPEQPDEDNDAPGPAQNDEPSFRNNYAVLIDEHKLDKLVYDLNETNTLSTTLIARQHSAFATQIAIVNDISPAEYQQAEQPGELALDQALSNTNNDGIEQEALPQAQLPIELRLPSDLGSTYNNLRNNENLIRKQQRMPNTVAAADTTTAEAEAALGVAREATVAQADRLEEPTPQDAGTEPATGAGDAAGGSVVDPADPDAEAATEPARIAQPNEASQAPNQEPTPPSALDAARGNWLLPHLPQTRTTPILSWLQADRDTASQLVPITIQRVPTEQVKELRTQVRTRQREAAEPAQAGQEETGSEAETDADADAEAQAQAVEESGADSASDSQAPADPSP